MLFLATSILDVSGGHNRVVGQQLNAGIAAVGSGVTVEEFDKEALRPVFGKRKPVSAAANRIYLPPVQQVTVVRPLKHDPLSNARR